MKVEDKQNINKEVSNLVNNLFMGKKITKKDVERIKKMKNNRSTYELGRKSK